MKTRKKTKLCLQCNGVNPVGATHCAYCAGMLPVEEPEADLGQASAQGSSSMQDLFATAQQRPKSSGYVSARSSNVFIQDREPHVSEESINKPLYSVFDQPQGEQMGHLRDEIMDKPRSSAAISESPQTQSPLTPAPSNSFLGTVRKLLNSSIGETLSVAALIFAVFLGFLALLTLLFETGGRVVLSWTSSSAPWLFIGAALLFVLGWRSLNSEKTNQP